MTTGGSSEARTRRIDEVDPLGCGVSEVRIQNLARLFARLIVVLRSRIYGFAGAPSEAEGTHLITPRSERKSFAIFCMELPRQQRYRVPTQKLAAQSRSSFHPALCRSPVKSNGFAGCTERSRGHPFQHMTNPRLAAQPQTPRGSTRKPDASAGPNAAAALGAAANATAARLAGPDAAAAWAEAVTARPVR